MKINLAIGKAGELRVASELLLRGIDVYLPCGDFGIDLILQNGLKIQVKTANKSRHGKYQYYTFNFHSWRKVGKHYIPHNLEDIDFIVLWLLGTERFFIIPASQIRGKYSVRLGQVRSDYVKEHNRKESQYLKYENKWELLTEKR